MDMALVAQIALALALGIGLSASCGFRVFIPPLILSIASLAGFVDLGTDFAWMGTWQAILGFGVATVLEIIAYYVPAVDNALDTIAVPVSGVAGAVMTAALLGDDISPALRWTLAVIAGGGTAATTTTGTAALRVGSTATTAGLGNGVLSTVEATASTGLSVISIALPILGFVLAVIVLVFAIYAFHRLRKRRKERKAQNA